tara:strand:- start:2699 stop:3919 length:1221 start_codon:yes stop_codon:yes gene_type:complete
MNEQNTPKTVGKTRWDIALLAILSGVIAATQIGKVPPAMPVLGAELAVGMVALGWIASIFNATGAVLGLPFGALSDGFGHRRVLTISLWTIAAGSLLGALTDNYTLLFATRVIEGIGYLGIIVAAPSLVVEATNPRDFGLALGLWSSFLPFGFALMMVLSPWFLDTVGWQGLWLFNAGLLATFAVVFMIGTRDLSTLPNRPDEPPTLRLGQAFGVASLTGPWLLVLALVAYTLQWFGLNAWMPTFFEGSLGYTLGGAALLSALVVFANGPGAVFGSWLLHVGWSNWLLTVIGCASMGIIGFAVFSGFVPDSAKFWLALAFSFLGGLLPPAIISLVPNVSPSRSYIGAVNGFVMQGNNFGYMMGAPIFAFAIERTGTWESAGWLLLALGVFGVGVGFVYRRHASRAR